MKRLSSLLFVSALSLSSLSAATVFSGALPSYPGSNDVFNDAAPGAFTAGGGGVDLLTAGDPSGYSTALCGGISCVDLDGTVSAGTAGGSISASFTLAPGTYTLTFDLFAAQRGASASSTVTLSGGLLSKTFADGSFTPGVQTDTITVATGGTYTLTFTSLTPGYYGDLVGGVTLASPSAVPEPSTILLMSLPLLAFGSRMFRRARV